MEKQKKKDIKKNNKNYEEPNYWKTICACVLIIVILVAGYLAYKKIYDKNKTYLPEVEFTTDERNFKKEYESLNGKNNSNEEILKNVSIIEDNNIEYVTLSEAVKLLKEDTGVMYFAYPTNQKSRIVSPILVNAASNTSLEKIYYLNVRPNDDEASDIRDSFAVNKKKAQKNKDADEDYYELLKILDKYLPKYTLTTSSGDVVNTGEKRLNVPTIITFEKGVIGTYIEGTIDNHDYDKDGVLRDLSKKEVTELNDKITEAITTYLESGCSIEEKDGC